MRALYLAYAPRNPRELIKQASYMQHAYCNDVNVFSKNKLWSIPLA